MAYDPEEEFVVPRAAGTGSAPAPTPAARQPAQYDPNEEFVVPASSVPPGERSLMGDVARGFGSSALGTVAAGLGGMEYVAGSDGTLTRWRESVSRASEEMAQRMSPQMQAALAREFIPGGEGESAWSSFGNFFGSVAAQMVGTSGSLAAAVPAIIAAGMAGPYAIPVATGVAAATGVTLGGGTVWNQAAEEFGRLDESARLRNPTYATLRQQGVDEASAINETVREAAAGSVELAAAGSGVINAFTGGFLGRLGSRNLGGIRRGAAEGLRTEAATEFLEEGLQTDQGQRVRERLTGEDYSLRETAEGAVRGAVAGGGLGAGMGALGGAVSRRRGEEPPETPSIDPSLQAALTEGAPPPGGDPGGAPPAPTPPAPSPMSDPLGAAGWAASPASASAPAPGVGIQGGPNGAPGGGASADPSIVAALDAGTPPAPPPAPSPAPQISSPTSDPLGAQAWSASPQSASAAPPAPEAPPAPPPAADTAPTFMQELARTNPQQAQKVEAAVAQARTAIQDGLLPAQPTPKQIREVLGVGANIGAMAAAIVNKGAPAPMTAPAGEVAATGSDSAATPAVGAPAQAEVVEALATTTRSLDAPAQAPTLAPVTGEAQVERAPIWNTSGEMVQAPPGEAGPSLNAPLAPEPQGVKTAKKARAKKQSADEKRAQASEPTVTDMPVESVKVEARTEAAAAPVVAPAPQGVKPPAKGKPGPLAKAIRDTKNEMVARTRSVIETEFGEAAFDVDPRTKSNPLDDANKIIDEIMEQAAREVAAEGETRPAAFQKRLLTLVQERVGEATRKMVEAKREADARDEAQEQEAARQREQALENPEAKTAERFGKNDRKAALAGNLPAIRKVFRLFSRIDQKNIPAWYRNNFAEAVEAQGGAVPEWLAELRKIAESAAPGGSLEGREARTAAVAALRERFAAEGANAESETQARATGASEVFDKGAPKNAATEGARERMQRYRAMRQELAKTMKVGSRKEQLALAGRDKRAQAVITFLNAAGRGTDANFDAETANSFALAELLIRAGRPEEALTALREFANVESTGLGTGGESDSSADGKGEARGETGTNRDEQLDELDVSGAELGRQRRAAERLHAEARREEGAPALEAPVETDDRATAEEIAAIRAARANRLVKGVVANAQKTLDARREAGANTLSLGGRATPRARANAAQALTVEDIITFSKSESQVGRFSVDAMPENIRDTLVDGNGAVGALRRGLTEMLVKALPGVEIIFVKESVWRANNGAQAAGVFMPNSIENIAAGQPPGVVYVRESLLNNSAELRETILHELVHAGTVASTFIKTGRARAKLTKLMQIARDGLKAQGIDPELYRDLQYALSNPQEFIAMAMTNENVQFFLGNLEVTPEQRKSLGLVGFIRNAFQAFVQWARESIGAPPGYYSVLEGVIEVASTTGIQSESGQRAQMAQYVNPRFADENTTAYGSMFSAVAEAARGVTMEGARDTGAGVLDKAKRIGYAFSTMRQIEMMGRRLFTRDARMQALYPNSQDNAIEVATKTHLERSKMAAERLRAFVDPLKSFQALPAQSQQTVSELLLEATIAEAHPDADISKGGPNEHLIGTGTKKVQARARHERLKARYASLNTAERKAYQDAVSTLKRAHETAVDSIIGATIDRWFINAVEASLRDPVKNPLPATAADLPGLKQRARTDTLTDAEKEMLGDRLFETLNTARKRRKMNGPYVPLSRFGDYVVAWKENAPETMTFATQDEANTYAENTEYAVMGESTHHFDAQDNEITTPDPAILANLEGLARSKAGADPDRAELNRALKAAAKKALKDTIARDGKRTEYRVKQQVNGLAMFETLAEARALREELRANGSEVRELDRRQSSATELASLLQEADFDRLKESIERDKGISDEHRAQALEAVAQAFLAILPNRALNRTLIKRRKVIGASKNVKHAIANYGVAVSNFSSGLETALPITMALKSMREQTRDGSMNSGADTGNTLTRRNIVTEMEQRLLSSPTDGAGGGSAIPWVRKIQSLAYIFYLASPSYAMIQSTQPWMLGIPVLAGRASLPAAAKALGKATRDIGLWEISKGGAKDLANAMRTFAGGREGTPQPILADLKSRIAKLPDGKELVAMLDALEREGLVDGEAGLELVRAELMRDGYLGTKLGQAESLARAFPAAIEVVNRTSTAIAAYRLERAKGKTPEQATAWAREAVDQSQADYSSANTARYMDPRRYPWLAPMMTFRKYAQAVYSLVIRNTYAAFKDADPEMRRQARRTLTMTLGTHGLVAGALGLPTEAINILLGATSLLFGADEPWDWETDARQALSEAFGPEVGEIIARGLPRAAGIDLHGRMGLNSLLFFNDVRDFEQRSLTEYAGQLLLGAPGAMLTGMLAAPQAIADGQGLRAVESAVPKGLRDVLKTIRMEEEGVTTRRGERIDGRAPGESGLNGWETFIQAMGFTPARIAETYERRNAVQGANRRLNEERTSLMRAYRQAEPADRRDAWERIVEWNNQLPPDGREARITRETLIRSVREATRRQRTSGGEDYLPRGREFLRREGEFANTRS